MKIAIGTIVQWYEIKLFPLYIESLNKAIKHAYDVLGMDLQIYVDIKLARNTDLEKPTTEMIDADDIIFEWFQITKTIESPNVQILEGNIPAGLMSGISTIVSLEQCTVAGYRRWFNSTYSKITDVLIWGETDMLAPKTMFTNIYQLHQYTSQESISCWVATFGSCKMWDVSWQRLEHVDFEDKPFIENDTENWWSLKYNMTLAEMDEINERNIEKANELYIFPPNIPRKFNGCGLVISSEIILQGMNIPENIFFVHEDTAFMNIINRQTQMNTPTIPQFVFKNVLLVHNRKHPLKRIGIMDEESIPDSDVGAKRKTHAWYPIANRMCWDNVNNIGNISWNSYSWKDVFESIN